MTIEMILTLALSLLAAYLIGSIPASFVVAKIFKGVDIRKVGSKNVGATNVLRVAGKFPAVIALLVDISKGIFVCTLVSRYFYSSLSEILYYEFYRGLLGFVAVSGHIWSVFLRFKGGKGVATTLGVFIVMAPMAIALSLALWLIIFLLTNYVSVASIFLALSLPVFSALSNKSFWTVFFAALIAALTIYKHKENIRRLVRGEESKTVIFKKPS